jgi:hypothetical protein
VKGMEFPAIDSLAREVSNRKTGSQLFQGIFSIRGKDNPK